MAKVEKAGFGISLAIESKKERQKEEKEKEESLKEAKHRLTWAILFAVPLLYLAMGHMLPFELPLPKIIQMEIHPLRFAVLQLILTLPVLYFGRNFYIKGFRLIPKPAFSTFAIIVSGSTCASSYTISIRPVVKLTSLFITPGRRLVTRSTALLHAAQDIPSIL